MFRDKRDLKWKRNLSIMARGSLIGGVHLSHSQEPIFSVGWIKILKTLCEMRPEDGLRFETLAIRRHSVKNRGENVYKMLSNKLNSFIIL